MSAPIHIFVCRPGDGGQDILAEWTFRTDQPEATGRGREMMLGAAFVERLAKHLRTKTHRACRVAEPTSETLPAACPSPGTLEDAAGRETLDQEGRA